MDSDRHSVVTFVSMGEENVVEGLHGLGLRPRHKAQGQRGDPQGQAGERGPLPVQRLPGGPRGSYVCPPASKHLPGVAQPRLLIKVEPQ